MNLTDFKPEYAETDAFESSRFKNRRLRPCRWAPDNPNRHYGHVLLYSDSQRRASDDYQDLLLYRGSGDDEWYLLTDEDKFEGPYTLKQLLTIAALQGFDRLH